MSMVTNPTMYVVKIPRPIPSNKVGHLYMRIVKHLKKAGWPSWAIHYKVAQIELEIYGGIYAHIFISWVRGNSKYYDRVEIFFHEQDIVKLLKKKYDSDHPEFEEQKRTYVEGMKEYIEKDVIPAIEKAVMEYDEMLRREKTSYI
jgi:hypothetical protein